MTALPTGTVTFLFTDLEGSTRTWEQHSDLMGDALARHDEMLRAAVAANGGHVVGTRGDGLFAVFAAAHDAVNAAVAAQGALQREVWDTPRPLRVRMGLHSGVAELRDGDYYGAAVNRAARISAAAHGGQIVASRTVVDLASDDLGPSITVEPLGEHRLRDLERPERLVQITDDGLDASFPPLRSLEALAGNLARPRTAFVGRRRALADIATLLDEAPVVTLIGVGGVGKTRLALQVADEAVRRFPDGAWFVDLAPLSDADVVPDTVATALGLPSAAGAPLDTTIAQHLRLQRRLLVLDNCEHVLERVAPLVETIAAHCPRVVILATSREALGVAGESVYSVSALAVPETGATLGDVGASESVQLFVDRARATRSDFALSADNVDGVATICRRLDGVPLALVLAAARVTSLHPAQIAERLNERFRILTAGRRTAVERHQTLRATIDWSYDLLTEQEQRALDRMAVFAGGCALEAAEAVLPAGEIDEWEVVDVLTRLVEQSLVIADESGAEVRYRLLETIRLYAAERLAAAGETEDTLGRHAAHYRRSAQVIGDGLHGADEGVWRERYESELQNLRGAVAWFARRDDAEHALGLVFDLYALSFIASTNTIDDLAVAALEAPSSSRHPLGPPALVLAADRAAQQGDQDEAARLLSAADEAERRLDTPCHPIALYVRFRIALLLGDLDDAGVCIEELTARDDIVGNHLMMAWAMLSRAAVESYTTDAARSVPLFRRANELARASANPPCITMTLGSLAWALRDDEPGEALQLLDEAIALAASTEAMSLVIALSNRLVVHARRGLVRAAITDGRAMLAALEPTQERNYIAAVFTSSAIALAELDRPAVAAMLYAAAGSYTPVAMLPAWGWQHVGDRVRAALGPEQFERCSEWGRTLDKDAALTLIATELDVLDAQLDHRDRPAASLTELPRPGVAGPG